MVYLRYVGRKLPFTFENPRLKTVLKFGNRDEVIEVPDADADWIFKHNPDGFVERVYPERQHSEPVPKNRVELFDVPDNDDLKDEPEEEPKPPEDLICPYCHKRYTSKDWYDRHVAKCGASEDG